MEEQEEENKNYFIIYRREIKPPENRQLTKNKEKKYIYLQLGPIWIQQLSLRKGLFFWIRNKRDSPSGNGKNSHTGHLQTSFSKWFVTVEENSYCRTNHVVTKEKRDEKRKEIKWTDGRKHR